MLTISAVQVFQEHQASVCLSDSLSAGVLCWLCLPSLPAQTTFVFNPSCSLSWLISFFHEDRNSSSSLISLFSSPQNQFQRQTKMFQVDSLLQNECRRRMRMNCKLQLLPLTLVWFFLSWSCTYFRVICFKRFMYKVYKKWHKNLRATDSAVRTGSKRVESSKNRYTRKIEEANQEERGKQVNKMNGFDINQKWLWSCLFFSSDSFRVKHM